MYIAESRLAHGVILVIDFRAIRFARSIQAQVGLGRKSRDVFERV
jgi:hypothetical protein